MASKPGLIKKSDFHGVTIGETTKKDTTKTPQSERYPDRNIDQPPKREPILADIINSVVGVR